MGPLVKDLITLSRHFIGDVLLFAVVKLLPKSTWTSSVMYHTEQLDDNTS